MKLLLYLVFGLAASVLVAQADSNDTSKQPSGSDIVELLGKKVSSSPFKAFCDKYNFEPRYYGIVGGLENARGIIKRPGWRISIRRGVVDSLYFWNQAGSHWSATGGEVLYGVKWGSSVSDVEQHWGTAVRKIRPQSTKNGVKASMSYPQHGLKVVFYDNRLFSIEAQRDPGYGESKTGDVQLRIVSKQIRLQMRDDLEVLAELSNHSQYGLRILNMAHTQPGVRACFRLWGPDGSLLRFKGVKSSIIANPQNLPAAGKLTQAFRLKIADWEGFDKPGVYSIEYTYDGSSRNRENGGLWQEKIISNVLKIERREE